MKIRQIGKFVSRLGLVIFFIASLRPCTNAIQESHGKLPGDAEIPTDFYKEWSEIQGDVSMDTITKIKATVDTYFLVKYESWLLGVLLDFGFLFDLSDSSAFDDYAYERGIHHLFLTGLRYLSSLILHYEYTPEYQQIEINGNLASVIMWPYATYVHRRSPERVDRNPWVDHYISLVKKENQWLICDLYTHDEMHDSSPRGTDFDKLADTYEERAKSWEAEQKKRHEEDMNNDPRYRKMVESRMGRRAERFAQQRQDEEDRISVYHEIEGEYKIEGIGIISFYVEEKYLMAREGRDAGGIMLQRIGNSPVDFQYRPSIGEVHELRFSRDEDGQITRCTFIKHGKEFQGHKIIKDDIFSPFAEATEPGDGVRLSE
jgi:hypothetical protein